MFQKILKGASHFDAFSDYLFKRGYWATVFVKTTQALEACKSLSLRTQDLFFILFYNLEDRNQTGSRRSEPNSRTFLIDEQSNP